MVIFWNFAGVPFVCWSSIFRHLPLIRNQRHMFTLWFIWPHMIRPCTVSRHPHRSCSLPHYLLRIICQCDRSCVCLHFIVLTLTFTSVGTHQWLRRVILRCRLKAFIPSATRFLSYHGIQSRTLPIFKRLTGTLRLFAWLDATIIFYPLRLSDRLLTSGWWAYSRKPVSVIIFYFLSKLTLIASTMLLTWSWALPGERLSVLQLPFHTFTPCSSPPYSSTALDVTSKGLLCSLNDLTSKLNYCARYRCSIKYGKDWERYCSVVKYKFIPGIY